MPKTPPFVGGTISLGQEWLVDARGCPPERLRDPKALAALFETLVVELKLSVVGTPQWHVFPGPGGITGLAMLSESHLAIHTFPEHGVATLSIYSCRDRAMPPLAALVGRALQSNDVGVHEVKRGGA